MNLNRVQQQFEGYMAKAFSDGVPKHQYIELRRAFFGGAAILFEEIGKSQDDDLRICAELEVEFAQFAIDVREGRA
jgi:hypothetical protein